jgi:DNA helicase-2/ATP-dependent DNA helicase PcrA
MRLTPQQQAVVDHTYGPALVFAVAGAGKTTALEHRIKRLVQEGIFAPARILAAAYNTAVKEELAARLAAHAGCAGVQVMTLHALALSAVRLAWQTGLLPSLKANAFAETKHAQDAILNGALAEARRRKTPYASELDNLDRNDFLTWMSSCRGNLLYPNLENVPATLRQTGYPQQATPPPQNEWYLPFAQLMDTVQQERGLITFDDQLRLGWEVLASHRTILTTMQQRFDCVLVDEFQDVNRAQYLILDLITAPRADKPQRNYMVVGDDDQTIYEWRGANPYFIGAFGDHYQATTYVMSENFRCPAAPLALANAVIRHNRQRYPKSLRLTQGMGGVTDIRRSRNREEMGQQIVADIRRHLQQGDRIRDIAVLVRAKAQTPPVEMALIRARLPYEVVGSEPFYARWEIATLVAYCRLALFEHEMQKGKRLSQAEMNVLLESWDAIYRHPKRYISQSDAQQIAAALAESSRPLAETLRGVVVADKPYLQPRLKELAALLEWLSGAFDSRKRGHKPAHAQLQELEHKLRYTDYLEKRGTLSEAGVDEAENVRQFIDEAKGHGTLLEYLVAIKRMAEEQATQQTQASGNLITIRTIHSAKGLEWKVVILPSCDDNNIPHRKSENVEEERRLLYVALTRSRRDLYIYHLNREPSTFLTQAKWHTVLRAVAHIRAALQKPPAAWSKDERAAVVIAAPQLGLMSYFQDWHAWRPGEEAAIQLAAQEYLAHLNRRDAQRYAAIREAWEQGRGSRAPKAESLNTQAFPQATATPKPTPKPTPAPKPTPRNTPAHTPSPRPSAARATTPASATPSQGRAHAWQTFDEVSHPQHGRGLVVSTTTTTRGRELKVRFADGNMVQFHDDDPALQRA